MVVVTWGRGQRIGGAQRTGHWNERSLVADDVADEVLVQYVGKSLTNVAHRISM